ncbi:hypothetical protein [Clostridium sp. Marseille-QA1073]
MNLSLCLKNKKIDINLKGDDAVIFAVKEDIRTILVNLIDNGINIVKTGE